MPPSKAILDERMVKRVDNAIHNPTRSAKDVYDAILELKPARVRVMRGDYDTWIKLAIESNDLHKLCAIFTGKRWPNPLALLFEHSPHSIPSFIGSRLFNPNAEMYETLITDWMVDEQYTPGSYSTRLTLFFKQPRTYKLLLRLVEKRAWLTMKEKQYYMNLNPVLRKRKLARKVLLRFWLLTTKPMLRCWRESLYVPGTGAIYKKALASFTEQSEQ